MATNDLPWFRCFPDRLLGALAEMDSNTQHVYVTVLLKIYARGGPIRNDPAALGAFCRRPRASIKSAIERLIDMGRLVELPDGLLSNPVADEELAHRELVSSTRAETGRRGGENTARRYREKTQRNQAPAAPIAAISEANGKQGSSDKEEDKIPPEAPQGGPIALLENSGEEKSASPDAWSSMVKAYRADAWMLSASARRAFDELPTADQAMAIVAAPIYRAEIAKTQVSPKSLKNWLREGVFRAYADKARPSGNANVVFIREGSVEWQNLCRSAGKELAATSILRGDPGRYVRRSEPLDAEAAA